MEGKKCLIPSICRRRCLRHSVMSLLHYYSPVYLLHYVHTFISTYNIYFKHYFTMYVYKLLTTHHMYVYKLLTTHMLYSIYIHTTYYSSPVGRFVFVSFLCSRRIGTTHHPSTFHIKSCICTRNLTLCILS